jgi:hypothetical protein
MWIMSLRITERANDNIQIWFLVDRMKESDVFKNHGSPFINVIVDSRDDSLSIRHILAETEHSAVVHGGCIVL